MVMIDPSGLSWMLASIVTLIVLGRKGPHGFPFKQVHWHFPIE